MEAKYFLIFFAVVLFIYFYGKYRKNKPKYNVNYIENYVFPNRLKETLKKSYPHLDDSEIDMVIKGLKEYFHICGIANNKMVAMPSQVVDVVWHDFILFTQKYDEFCKNTFGRFLHHTPVEAMKSKTSAQEGIKRVWNISCKRESINPKTPHRLPLLFLLDKKLNIEDGFRYSLNCTKIGNDNYCATHIGCGTSCGSGCSSDGGNSGSSSCSSGCGGGD